MVRRIQRALHHHGRRVVVTIIGFTVLLVGLALLVLPGPAILVIPAGLAILATQFRWARDLLDAVRERTEHAFHRLRGDESDGSDRVPLHRRQDSGSPGPQQRESDVA